MTAVLRPDYISAALFMLTAVLLAFASYQEPTKPRKYSAYLSVLTVLGAVSFLINSDAWEIELLAQVNQPREADVRKAGEIAELKKSGGRGQSGAPAAEGSDGSVIGQVASILGADRRGQRPAPTIQDCPECPELVTVKPGYFTMGASDGDPDALPAERPQRIVRISTWLAIGRLEITVGQYDAFVRATGHRQPVCGATLENTDPRLPVTCVSWRDALAYIGWLRAKTGKAYRLPTEAEWEYAARGGADTRFAVGQHLGAQQANIGKHGLPTVPAGSFPGNGYGLQDVHGSVAELVADCWAENLRTVSGEAARSNRRGDCSQAVLRDAGAVEPVTLSRLSARRGIDVDARRYSVGFRVIRELEKSEL